jgi:WhiB family transcriptional regulator, redox-sensing transcriptional regulator
MSVFDILDDTPDWRVDASCLSIADDGLWFPETGSDRGITAKKVCSGCPVRVECLNDALRHGDEYGIRGGVSVHERRKLRRVMLGGAA